jgi:hypothetical protein
MAFVLVDFFAMGAVDAVADVRCAWEMAREPWPVEREVTPLYTAGIWMGTATHTGQVLRYSGWEFPCDFIFAQIVSSKLMLYHHLLPLMLLFNI